ncbi:MAG: hypothetical protein ABIV21_08430 [Pyrinomonadaceae bacterium]
MATKYDTNPLDPDFPEKAKAAATQNLGDSDGATRQFADPAEEQTRRFARADTATYSQPFNYTPGAYQPVGFANDRSATRKIEKVGLPENVLTALPYLPWYVGMVAGLLILFLVPGSETKVRFHAAQGLAAHIGILIVTTILGILGNVTGVAEAGNAIFQIVMTVMLIVWAIKAWKGKPVHIESVDPLTNWLEEKISAKT